MSPKKEMELSRRIDMALQVGVERAIEEHRKAGRSIAVWRDGKVAIIPAKAIGKMSKRKVA